MGTMNNEQQHKSCVIGQYTVASFDAERGGKESFCYILFCQNAIVPECTKFKGTVTKELNQENTC